MVSPPVSRRRFLQTSSAFWLSASAGLRAAAPGETREELLLAAADAIRQHRQSAGVVTVVDSWGRPVQGALLQVEQVAQDFLFGCNCFSWGHLAKSGLEQPYRRRFAALFNGATLGFYWAAYEPERGRPAHPYIEDVLEWCRVQAIRPKGHPLVWASIPDPDWLPEDAVSIHGLAHARVQELVSLFQGRIELWDVVNEPTLLSWAETRFGRWAQSVGTRAFVADFLRTARRANPAATLLVNDVLTEMPYYSLLQDLRDDSGRLLLDAVGIQSHMHGQPWPLRQVQSVCDEYGRLGLPLHFTEVSVLSGGRRADGSWQPTEPHAEEVQAAYVADLYTLLFSHPAVQAIGWWDLSDLGAWKGAAAGLLRPDMTPKPAYERLLRLVRQEWWTRVQGRTAADGQFPLRAFHGRLRVMVYLGERREAELEFSWRAGRDNRVTVVLPPR